MSGAKKSFRIGIALAICVVMMLPGAALGEEAVSDVGVAPSVEATPNPVPEPAPAVDEDPIEDVEEPNDTIMYTVRFLDKYGSVLKTEQVEEGQAATAPEPPGSAGYYFIGWDSDFSNVTSDLTIHPLYVSVFVSGSFLSSSTIVVGDSKDLVYRVDFPYDPSKQINVTIEKNPLFRDANFTVTGDDTSTVITVHASSFAGLEPGGYLLWCNLANEFTSIGEFEIVAAEVVPVAATQQRTGLAKTGDPLPVGLASVGGVAFAGLAAFALYRIRKHD